MSYLQKYLEYLRNAGGSVTLEEFDDDWEPIGILVRQDLVAAGFAEERDGRIYPTSE